MENLAPWSYLACGNNKVYFDYIDDVPLFTLCTSQVKPRAFQAIAQFLYTGWSIRKDSAHERCTVRISSRFFELLRIR